MTKKLRDLIGIHLVFFEILMDFILYSQKKEK